ncbi:MULTISPECIES: TolC family protein [Chryseobacterium]|uniref:Type I secretion outer membrane protein, TolC family n=1 Tax=Chryseobacterium taihuense TaxID=1141221 RepID=A0A4U8WAB1_9FLAO|nr:MULTISPECIES: TolC family protein [Chryseobacterium]QQV03547.1 TolC family protein [Chryseobacterium sp. FDAARGOS 1104]VFB03122.1 type I secretion outer membrane protein, TolC family [Chryseobacterium taihuense]
MKRINNSVIALLFWGAISFFHAQEVKPLSLDEAVQLGIMNSKSLKIDAAKIEEATADLLEAKNRQLPELKVSGSYMYLPLKPTIDLKLPGVSAEGGPEVHQVAFGSANLSIPIYSGGRIKYGIQSAKYLVEASKLNTENDKIAIAYNIAQAYNNLFKANQAIKVLEENLTASQKRDETFLKLENNGVIARNDRLKANLQTSNIELQLLEAKNNYNIANINMDLLLGLPETTELKVDENYIDEISDLKPVNYYLTEAQQNRKDLQALDQQKKAAELGTKAAKAENLPSIALTGGYVAADIPKFFTVYNAVNFGVGISYNLSNIWKKNSALQQSKAREMQLSATNDLLNDNIKLEVNKEYQNSDYSRKRIAVFEKSAEQANENYRITKNKYDNGLATMTELLDADAAQISANVGVINAKADAALAYRKLLQTTGTLTIK